MTYDFRLIHNLHEEGGLSWAAVADQIGASSKEAVRSAYRRWKTRQSSISTPTISAEDQRAETRTLTLEELSRLTSLDDLIEFFGVDTDEWEVRDYRVNSWEQNSVKKGLVTLYQVRANLVPHTDRRLAAIESARQAFIDDAEKHAPPTYPPPPARTNLGGEEAVLMEVAIHDPHFGMLAWGEETAGPNQDLGTIKADYLRAVERLLSFGRLYNTERVLYIVGHDMCHVNQAAMNKSGGVTARGTHQDMDGRLAKIFTEIRRTCVSALDDARLIAPVDVVVVPGNHDPDEAYRLGEVLNAWYRHDKEINVDFGPNVHRFYGYGKNTFMLTHGERLMKQKESLPLVMMTECPIELLQTSDGGCREIHTGHWHKKMQGAYYPSAEVDESRGIRVRSLPGLTAVDAWHHEQGYRARRSATVMFWYKSGGLAGQHEFSF